MSAGAVKVTPMMWAFEKTLPDEDIVGYLVEKIPELGIARTAKEIGIQSSTLKHWMSNLGLRVVSVVCMPEQVGVAMNAQEWQNRQYILDAPEVLDGPLLTPTG